MLFYWDWGLWHWEVFLTMMVLVFSLGLFFSGAFAAFFGSGRSKMIGMALLLTGMLIGLVYSISCTTLVPGLDFMQMHNPPVNLDRVMIEGMLYLSSAIIGGVLAIVVFLMAIMKS